MSNKKGIYCLVFRNEWAEIRIGKLGTIPFRKGWHIYVGSAQGNAGYARVERHRRVAEFRDRKPKWHVDNLLLSKDFNLECDVFCETSEELECPLAHALGGEEVRGFGSSDCKCSSHLFFRESNPLDEIKNAILSLSPEIDEKCLIICCM